MSNFTSFNVNGVDASINLASDTENGLMSSNNYNNINDLIDKIKELAFLDIGIDTDLGVLRICGKTYKLIEYDGDVNISEYVNPTSFIDSTSTIESPEFSKVILDYEDKVLYGIYIDGSETTIDLSTYYLTDPSTGIETKLSNIINSIVIN